ncbi:hypothetical protein [Streptomyces californicus]|uniref:hypothetical protein n=1 Tax=Streptomyces californicus TaxID=67351 RepID=UPI0037B9769E
MALRPLFSAWQVGALGAMMRWVDDQMPFGQELHASDSIHRAGAVVLDRVSMHEAVPWCQSLQGTLPPSNADHRTAGYLRGHARVLCNFPPDPLRHRLIIAAPLYVETGLRSPPAEVTAAAPPTTG